MADVVRRYQMQRLGVVDTDHLRSLVGGAVAISDNAANIFIDITADESLSASLDAAMLGFGFAFVEESPAVALRNAFGEATALQFLERVLATSVTVPSDQVLVARRLRIPNGRNLHILTGGEAKLI